MKSYRVKEMMIPLTEYATVSEDANLLEAVMALDRAQAGFDQTVCGLFSETIHLHVPASHKKNR